jgi:TIR domain-containing protein
MADVFISYSKAHVDLTRDLATDLEGQGLSVWWDTDLLAGESFRQRIVDELKGCKAVIVIWTRESVASDYVLSEAERARKSGKLIQIRTDDVAPDDLPPPFDTGHAALLSDRKSVYGALAKLGLLNSKIAASSDPLPLFPQRKPSALAALSEHKPMAIAMATLAIAAVLAGFALLKKPPPPAPGYRTASQQAEGATKVVSEFFDALNSGFADSSLFDSELRLGRRGNMTKVEAVTTLRQFQSQYGKVKCRPGGDAPALKTPELSRSDLRVKVDVDCDFADKKGESTSTSFPIEIEAAPDPQNAKGYLITGMWHSDKMILWQPRARD